MNFKKLIPLIAVALLLPTVATASVIVSDTYTVSVSTTTHGIYLMPGPNYATAKSNGYIYAPVTGSGNMANITSGSPIMVNYTKYSGTDYLMNVLEIKDVGVSGALYINGSLPSGISIYVSNNSQSSLLWSSSGYSIKNATTNSEASYSNVTPIVLTPDHIYYISFVIDVSGSSTLSGSRTLYLNYVYD
ncbi:hypothetical protein DMB44_02540 [Thermoplasma sp. Kam2015]|uniref:hypothetical protein n=1 Tax=Thermoplasma sp. Kam2015 TaxID=2094122 RepID=UPI000D9FFF83|nr:hypothetical protein [Thermoplasma sp. Kam2015]PYB68767.1 hypothetical protein DMB44_02540 [Thermoplasma sp. Kam2015]